MRVDFQDAVDDGMGHWVVKRTFTHDDGTVEHGVHVFPHDILESRAAEYGIDPADTDTLMDIVMVEPYMTDEDWSEGEFLFDAETDEDAKAAHLARCAKVKLRHRISTRAAGKKAHVLDHVKRQSPMHPEAIQLKREMVQEHKRRHQNAKKVRHSLVAENSDEERLSKLREHHRQTVRAPDMTDDGQARYLERNKQAGVGFWKAQAAAQRRGL